MYIHQLKKAFSDKKDTPCPLTERLVKAGYQQTGGGYIANAKRRGLLVDYTKAAPSQYWHLMESYIPTVKNYDVFTKQIVCGELIFWMAEVLNAVPKPELENLLNRIIASADHSTTPPKYDRRKWNKEIQNLCFDAVADRVEFPDYSEDDYCCIFKVDLPSYPVTIPEGETVVDDDELERYLKRHLRKEITFRYQSAKPDSGAKWRTLKLVEYDGTHFHCIDSDDVDHAFTYRRDRVLEIRD